MFNWFDKLLVKIAKKILNKYAPTGEFIAYINEQEEKVLKKLGGYGQPINETGIKSFISLGEIWESTVDFFQDNKDTIVDVGMGIGKAWIDMNDQERKNAVTEKAYNDYMAQVEAAGKEAESAVALNLTPMEITNVPQTKADVSSFTAVAARGGLMNLPTRHRKRYASQGFVEDDVEIMDPESLGDHELRMEEGVNIGEMAAFPDTGNDVMNAKNVWESGAINQDNYIDFNEFFQSGDWLMHISQEKVQGDKKIASSPDDFMTTDEMQIPQEEIMSMIGAQQAAQGGIIGLRHGGRARYADPDWIVKKSDVEEEQVPRMAQPATREELDIYNNIDTLTKVVITAPDGTMVPISQEDWMRIQNGEITKEEVLANAGYESNFEIIEFGNAKGGLPKRVRKAPGGIMNLGGLEKDYRTTGGFVPIGAYEKKDDVPARLSKNEFVMTADAVRAAGGGSINKGAQRMYDTMKHLEAQPQAKRMTA